MSLLDGNLRNVLVLLPTHVLFSSLFSPFNQQGYPRTDGEDAEEGKHFKKSFARILSAITLLGETCA